MDSKIQFPDIKPLHTKRYAKIIATGVGLPENVITNQDIIDRYKIIATDRAVQYSLGIAERRWVDIDDTLDGLMAKAVTNCLEKAGLSVDQISRIIYTRLLGDYQIPAASVALLRKLGATTGVPAFDISSACSGFMHAMDLALRYIATGDEYVLVIGGGITSTGIQTWKKPNPKTVFLFGDAIVAMLFGPSKTKQFFASYIITNHKLYDNAYIPCGTRLLQANSPDMDFDFDMFNMRIADGNLVQQSAVEYSRVIAEKLLSTAGLKLADIDFFVTSDQSTRIWEAQLQALGIPPEKSLSLFCKYGNTVAAMSPLNLNGLMETGRLKRGNLVMMMAHGAGASSGGMIFRY
jgi:3-oxoacyl-[acyl-carrier-protein] synthase-3